MKLEILQAKSLHDKTSVLTISRKSTKKWPRKTRVLPRKIIMKKENAYNNSKVFRWKRKTLRMSAWQTKTPGYTTVGLVALFT